MFVLIWATLLFSVRVSDAETGSSVLGEPSCLAGYCNTLVKGVITVEAGLCVVIPCSFTVPDDITVRHIIWFKCEPTKERCGDKDMIFHTNTNSDEVQSEFKGRVSLLESDVRQKNCSIIVNDLKESDSGAYQLRVTAVEIGGSLTFPERATVSVKGLSQRPTLMIPPLTDGRPTTLTCTAPGLCSGSEPTFTWRWRGRGESDANLTRSITTFKTENVAAFAKRSSSTLSFSPSAEHHGTNITCTVIFKGNVITEETTTLNVTYVKEVRITQNASVSEGKTLNLTCSVESFPSSLITWTKVSDQSSRNGTGTTLQNTTFSDLLYYTEERGNATLSIFNVTAEDSGQYVCTVTHMNSTWKENVNVTVIYMRDPVITGDLIVKEGDVLNLTCRGNSFPPSHVAWTNVSDQSSGNGTGTTLQNTTFSDSARVYYTEERGNATLSIFNVTAEDSGQYICTVTHMNSTWKKNVNVTVIYMRDPVITGDLIVKEGDVLNLTCRGNSFPPSVVAWTEFDSSTNPPNETDLKNDSVSSTLIIPNVTVEHSGHYICTAKHLNRTATTTADVAVTWISKILKSSDCVVKSGVLTCVCISEGFPLPTIKWPLLEHQTVYSVITTVSNYTVNSTVIVKGRNDSSVQCVSCNTNGEAKEKFNTRINSSELDNQHKELFKRWLGTIIAFLIGVLLSAVIFCLVKRCHRKKQKSPGNQCETMDMVTNHEDPLIHNGQAAKDAQTRGRKRAGAGSVAAGARAPRLDSGSQDVEYASIDFSLLKSKGPRDAAKKPETTETDYAEIQKQVKEEREDGGAEEGEVLEEAGIEEEEETNPFVPEEGEGGDMEVYSNVKDLMAEV